MHGGTNDDPSDSRNDKVFPLEFPFEELAGKLVSLLALTLVVLASEHVHE